MKHNNGCKACDVLIIGAGASGLMCAVEAGKRGRSVVVLEHSGRMGAKIRVSGGGRCNFTNLDMSPSRYLSKNPPFCRSALARYGPHDFTALLEKHGIGYHEKKAGQLFCNEGSERILQMLRQECDDVRAALRIHCPILEVAKSDIFSVSTAHGVFRAKSLVIATGGLSMPQLGATHFGYTVAKRFGLRVTRLRPALTPLRLPSEEAGALGALMGVAMPVEVACGAERFREDMLFTHRGLSGPAILQVSSYWSDGEALSINLVPDQDMEAVLLESSASRVRLETLLSRYVPRRFARRWCETQGGGRPLCAYSKRELRQLAEQLHHWRVTPSALEGYQKAEVTLGGVDTDELSSKTMESRKVPGLYFIGEVVDVTGQLGGFNLHWAWASGVAAGQFV